MWAAFVFLAVGLIVLGVNVPRLVKANSPAQGRTETVIVDHVCMLGNTEEFYLHDSTVSDYQQKFGRWPSQSDIRLHGVLYDINTDQIWVGYVLKQNEEVRAIEVWQGCEYVGTIGWE